jgi:hypothetical protein
MSNRSKEKGWLPRIMKVPSMISNYSRELFNLNGHAVLRQNAIRKAIANLIEVERMRLAATIANRDHN